MEESYRAQCLVESLLSLDEILCPVPVSRKELVQWVKTNIPLRKAYKDFDELWTVEDALKEINKFPSRIWTIALSELSKNIEEDIEAAKKRPPRKGHPKECFPEWAKAAGSISMNALWNDFISHFKWSPSCIASMVLIDRADRVVICVSCGTFWETPLRGLVERKECSI